LLLLLLLLLWWLWLWLLLALPLPAQGFAPHGGLHDLRGAKFVFGVLGSLGSHSAPPGPWVLRPRRRDLSAQLCCVLVCLFVCLFVLVVCLFVCLFVCFFVCACCSFTVGTKLDKPIKPTMPGINQHSDGNLRGKLVLF
jgi:hypothetical protein